MDIRLEIKITLLLWAVFLNVNAQSHFQNIYADSTWDESHMTISPDAYYLAQTSIPAGINGLIHKVDLNGNLLWSKRIIPATGTAGSVSCIAYHDEAVYVVGNYQNIGYQNFFARLDTSGNVQWSRQLTYGDINVCTRIIPLSSGFLLSGHRDFFQAGDFTFDVTLTRLDDSGNQIWAKAYGNNFLDFTCAAAVVAANYDIVIAGNYGVRMPPDYDPLLARFDSTGNLIWMKTFADASGFFTEFTPTDLCNTADGNFALTGYSKNTNANYDPHLIKFDNSGSPLWAKRLYQIGWQEYGNSILSNSSGNLVVTGIYSYLQDYGDFAAQFDLSGNFAGSSRLNNTAQYYTTLNDIYHPRGGDLFERTGSGYAYNTFFQKDYGYMVQCLITTDYSGITACNPLNGIYPFSVADIIWSLNAVAVLPGYQTNITSSVGFVSTAAMTWSSEDICVLLGISDAELNSEILVWPNPVSNRVNIRLNSKAASFEVRDVTGRIISTGNLQAEMQSSLDLSSAESGIYMLWLKLNDGSHTSVKLIKNN